MEYKLPKVGDIVKIVVGDKLFPKYYAVIKSYKQIAVDEYDCKIEIHKSIDKSVISTIEFEFDYLQILDKKELKQIGC